MLFREDMGRNTRKWTAIEIADLMQSSAYRDNKTLTQKSEILGRWANYQASFFFRSICSSAFASLNVAGVFVG